MGPKMKRLTQLLLLIAPLFCSAQKFTKVYAAGDTLSRKGNGYLARNIQFQLDKAILISPTNPVLDSIAVFLTKNDSLVIEIGVHGSTRNPATACNQLTQGRAKSIADYLSAKGIDPQRLHPKGYGQTHLLYSDAQIKKTQDPELSHLMNQRNRRVEFIILKGQMVYSDSSFTHKSEARNRLVNGIKEGRWVEYYHHDVEYTGIERDSSKASFYVLTFYKHGQPYGVQRQYDRGGLLMFETPFSDSGKNGIQKRYYDQEFKCPFNLWMEISYVDGKKNGLEKDYFCSNGKLWKETLYDKDEPDGLEREYYETGKLKYIRTYSRGRIVGLEKEYYENGNPKTEIQHDENGWEKKRTTYDESGREIKR